MFAKADLDEDGFVTLEDFYNIMTHRVYWDQWLFNPQYLQLHFKFFSAYYHKINSINLKYPKKFYYLICREVGDFLQLVFWVCDLMMSSYVSYILIVYWKMILWNFIFKEFWSGGLIQLILVLGKSFCLFFIHVSSDFVEIETSS